MSQKYLVTRIYFFLSGFFILRNISYSDGIKVQGMSDLLHNFEAMDPEVLNILTFNSKQMHRNGDSSEINLMDIDTSDILNCFSTLSYTCFQKKIIFYLDSLNRVEKINLFGGYMSFVRVSQGVTPPITEQMLASRHITDENSLSTLLRDIFDDFIDSHILRITVPVINTRLDARSARGHCYDFNLGDNKSANNDSFKDSEARSKDLTCYRGDQTMIALSSALLMKMLMLLPTLLKVIAAKAIFGLLMGVVSVILSKMAILPLLLSYAKKNTNPVNPTPTGSSYRQGINPTNFALTTDNYGLHYGQDEQSGRIPSEGGNLDNNIISQDYGPSGINESKLSNRNYNNQNGDVKYKPRKERYRSLRRRSTSKPKKSGYLDMIINGENIERTNFLTTEEVSTVGNENDGETLDSKALIETKKWNRGSPYKHKLSF